jgi:hypothetical protein
MRSFASGRMLRYPRPFVYGEPMAEAPIRGQVMLLSSTRDTLTPYIIAAKKLGVECVRGIEAGEENRNEAAGKSDALPGPFAAHADGADETEGARLLPLRFAQRESALQIVQYAMEHPLAAVVAADEYCAPTCARASSMMGLPSNPPKAADLCLDKFALRQRLSNAGLRTPLLGEPPTGRDVTVAAVLSGGKMRVLGAAEGGQARANVSEAPLNTMWHAIRAVSLSHGPVSASLRLAGEQTWILDIVPAIPRQISELLRFKIPLVDEDVSLAEVILRHTLGLNIARIYRK